MADQRPQSSQRAGSEIISKDTSYSDFLKVILSTLTLVVDNNIQILMSYGYEGFSSSGMYKIFLSKCTGKSGKEITQDLVTLLGLFHVRGPNVANLKKDNTKGKGDDFDKLQNLIALYSIKSKKPTSTDITLPRLSMVFPIVSFNVYNLLAEKLESFPVTANEIGLPNSQFCFPNFIPSLLNAECLQKKHTATVFFVHNIYQCYLSFKTQKPGPSKDSSTIKSHPCLFFHDATKYSVLASNNSLVSSDETKECVTLFVNRSKEVLNTDSIKKLASNFFITKPTMLLDNMPTVFHIAYNTAVKRGSTVSVVDNMFEMSYSDALKEYNNN